MTHIRPADALTAAGTAVAFLAAAAGLAVPGLFRDTPFWADQARGTDLATLLLVTPVLALGLVTAQRGSQFGRLAVVGGLLYLIYNYAIFSFAVAMNPLTIAYIAALGAAVWALALSLPVLDASALAADARARLPRRLTAVVLVSVALLFGALWLGQIVSALVTGALPSDLVRAGLPTNPVYALDLGLFLPLALLSGAALWRGHPAGPVLFAMPMLLWLCWTSAGIVASFSLQAASGAAVPLPIAILVAAIGLLTGAIPAAAVLSGRRQIGHHRRDLPTGRVRGSEA